MRRVLVGERGVRLRRSVISGCSKPKAGACSGDPAVDHIYARTLGRAALQDAPKLGAKLRDRHDVIFQNSTGGCLRNGSDPLGPKHRVLSFRVLARLQLLESLAEIVQLPPIRRTAGALEAIRKRSMR
jgi:hypothetical protein